MAAARVVACLLAAVMCLSCGAARSPEARMHRHLKRLNKPAVKSIESPDGDIIDCVHISHQPAFDHPFLKNHTIQMRPSYHPEGLYDESKANVASSGDGERPMVQLWHRNGRCAPGTVPVRRTKKDDLMRATSMRRYGRKHKPTVANPMSVDLAMLNEGGHQARDIVRSGREVLRRQGDDQRVGAQDRAAQRVQPLPAVDLGGLLRRGPQQHRGWLAG
ncbi:unnamed protein product [Triticum turgidum subsp. durum]|uniref:Neprosin activation peptide domain-containing protein n=1 Tax=Triticum turgidum subsp. durum TaxID=4567 RepID=A0A9R0XL52_TRITD|nr:unnamed protein product [Triticum turgidum subsp. durum]